MSDDVDTASSSSGSDYLPTNPALAMEMRIRKAKRMKNLRLIIQKFLKDPTMSSTLPSAVVICTKPDTTQKNQEKRKGNNNDDITPANNNKTHVHIEEEKKAKR